MNYELKCKLEILNYIINALRYKNIYSLTYTYLFLGYNSKRMQVISAKQKIMVKIIGILAKR